jgi:hypothetical protein
MTEIFTDKNAPYLLTAYVVFLGGLLLYFASLRMRSRSLERDRATIEQIERESASSQDGAR